MEGLEHLLFIMAFDVLELSWSWSICPLRMVENMPCRQWRASAQECWLEFHFRGGDTQLREVWIRRVQWGGGGLSPPGKPFLWMASHCLLAAPKVILESKHNHTLLPKLIVQLGLPIFLPLMGLCTRPRGVGLQACFAQGVCLWVTLSYDHNLKNCMNILLTWLNSWGVFPDSPFLLFNNILKIWWGLLTITWPVGL